MKTGGSIESQQREVEKLFFRIANASDPEMRTQLLDELAGHLMAYAAIEDQPAGHLRPSGRTANARP